MNQDKSIDSNVEAVREQMRQRAEFGLQKYGVTTERTDLTIMDWIQHAQDEAMDLCVYLERLKQEFDWPLMSEDQLPRGMSEEDYQKWISYSSFDENGIRVGPRVILSRVNKE